MGKCTNHPDRETSYMCMKHGVYLCEECRQCRDPEIYCKFRSACPIWFLQKKGTEGWVGDEKAAETAPETVRVVFQPDGRAVDMPAGGTLLEAAVAADVHLNASCNGKGSCGKCKLILESGPADRQPTALLSDAEKEKNYVLACQTVPRGEVTVKIPEETLEKKLKAAGMGKAATEKLQGLVADISPMLMEIPLDLEPPTLEDSVSDLDRLNRGLKRTGFDVTRLNVGVKVIRELAAAMRDDNWHVTASIVRRKCSNEVLRVNPGNGDRPSLGLAVDVGTTSIVTYLVDMQDGRVIAATSGHNRDEYTSALFLPHTHTDAFPSVTKSLG